jgi:general secretion pathway protein L
VKNWLGIHLEHKAPDEATPVAWALFGGDNRLITQGQGPLGRVRAQAGREAEKAEVYVYVPGSSVNLAEVSIPSRQIAHLRKALPFMIEDFIAGDLRQTHLAVAPQRFGDSVPVAIVSHAQMIAWLEALHGAGLSPAAIIPEHLLLSRDPGSIFVHVHFSRAHVRLGDCRGIVVELENLVMMLDLALQQRAMPCSRIEISACATNGEDMANADRLAAEVSERLERPVRRTNYKETLVELLSTNARGPHAVLNLCQGGYRVSAARGEGRRRWTSVWLSAAASIAVFILGCVVAGWLMEREALEVRDQTVATFRKMFPDEGRIVNLRRQAETRLAAGSGGASDVMRGMAALAGSLGNSEVVGVTVEGLRYSADGGALGVELHATSLAQIDQLEQLLAGAGMSAKVLSASEEGGVASARVELRAQ